VLAVLAAVSAVAVAPPAPAAAAPTHAELSALYARATTAGAAFTRAQQELVQADRELVRAQQAARAAQAELDDQSAAVAAFTVQQLQDQVGTSPMLTMLGREDPRDLLARSSIYDSVAEAMTARIDDLSARRTILQVTQRRLERSRAQRQEALREASVARATINEALAESKRATLAAAVHRETPAPRHMPTEELTERPTEPGSQPPPAESPALQPSAAAPSPPPPAIPAPAADDDVVWDRIAACESGGNWHINTGNGYYGGLQFSARTWHAVGGPGLPHEQSREVQIYYAKILLARSGWDQWSCADARFA